MRRRLLTTGLAACLATLALATTAQAGGGKQPLVLPFEKDCPELTCWETARSPVKVSTEVTPISFENGIFRYTAVETISSAQGSVTLHLTGFMDTNAEPDYTLLRGTVASGSWNGKGLAGSRVYAAAYRVPGTETTFAGAVVILPKSGRAR